MGKADSESTINLPQRLILQNRFLAEDTKSILSFVVRFLALRLRESRARILHGHVIRNRRIKDFMAQSGPKRLHFGAGPENIPGFLNSDMLGNIPINICRKLPFGDDEIDLIYTSHLIEHVHKEDFKFFLRETWRILKPIGVHIIATPTIEKAAANVYGNGLDVLSTLMEPHRPFMQEDFCCPSHYLNHLMRWYDHKYIYDKCLIGRLAYASGYGNVGPVANFDLPDADLRSHLIQTKDVVWDLETETFILTK